MKKKEHKKEEQEEEQEEKKKKQEEKKLKLLPTLREKRHYLVVTVEIKEKQRREFDETILKEIINKAIINFIGVLGYAQAGPIFVESGIIGKKFYFIISVTTKNVDKVKAAIALIDEPNFLFRTIGVSGTIKKSRRFLALSK